jgi:hypothetical protein
MTVMESGANRLERKSVRPREEAKDYPSREEAL